MRTHTQRWPKEMRITWRRHLPIWFGLEGGHRGRRCSSVVGVYVRVGDRVRFFESDRRLAAMQQEILRRRQFGT